MARRGLFRLLTTIWYMCIICYVQQVDFAKSIFAADSDIPLNRTNSKGKHMLILSVLSVL